MDGSSLTGVVSPLQQGQQTLELVARGLGQFRLVAVNQPGCQG
jgi:hypothetical protein